MSVVAGWILPGRPQPLLAPEKSPAWQSLHDSFGRVREELAATDADLLLIYSTQWVSVIGHQIQADPEPAWTLVDQDWHDLGSIPYRFRMDAEFAEVYAEKARARGLEARTVAYPGFPIDTGTVVALSLIDPERRIPAGVVSCNMYSDRAETIVLGKAAADAIEATGRRAVVVACTALSNRLFHTEIDPAEDRISSLKDDEWNRKILEVLGNGRLEDACQLAREFTAEANADSKLKALWWLATVMGRHNGYDGRVLDYQPIHGSGAAIVVLTPSSKAASQLEFDEDDVEVYVGDRGVLGAEGAERGRAVAVASSAPAAPADEGPAAKASPSGAVVRTDAAPKPVGAYPHARRVGDFLFLSGIGPRQAGTDAIPGGPVRGTDGAACAYDAATQTRAVIDNIETILKASGATLDDVVDVSVFLIDMDRDFATFNSVYKERFSGTATRTTVAVDALPTPIAVELKVVAHLPGG